MKKIKILTIVGLIAASVSCSHFQDGKREIASSDSSNGVEKEFSWTSSCFVSTDSGSQSDAKRCAKNRAIESVKNNCIGKIKGEINTSFIKCERENSYDWPFRLIGYDCQYSASTFCNVKVDQPTSPTVEESPIDQEVLYATGCAVENLWGVLGSAGVSFTYTVKKTFQNGRVSIADVKYYKIIEFGDNYKNQESELAIKAKRACDDIRNDLLKSVKH